MPLANPEAPSRVSGVAKRIGFVGLGLFALLGLTSGLSGLLGFAGLYLVVTGLWAIVRQRSWLGPMRRRLGAGVLASGLVLTTVGGAVGSPADAPLPTAASPSVSASQTRTATTAPSPTATPTPTPSEPEPVATEDVSHVAPGPTPQTALAALDLLAVKGRAPKTGYTRDQFGQAWADVDRNGCDTRNDILRRDLTGTTLKDGTNGCVVLSGALADPYSGNLIAFLRGVTTSTAVQIDHVVALSDAWQKGAQALTLGQRTDLANDPLNLLAVDGPLNSQKGDGDAATWLPPNKAFRCQYVARQVAVKVNYGLWVTSAEHDAIARILSTCPDEPVPTGTAPLPTVAASAAPAPAPAPAPPAPPAPVAPAPVAPPATAYYANCTAARAAGVTPLHTGDPGYRSGLDRDHDGIACE
ncbi:MAG: DUF1524 domain-containing protein [Phycicoccus sp.]|nr:DUF1524 domain-containing protein [Phycicoccus sp.]